MQSMGKFFGSYSQPFYQKNQKFKNPTIFPSLREEKIKLNKSKKRYFTKSDLKALDVNPITLKSVLTKTYAYSTVSIIDAIQYLRHFYLDGYMRKVFKADGNKWKLPARINFSLERGYELLGEIFYERMRFKHYEESF